MKLRIQRPSPGLVALAALIVAFVGGSLVRTGFGIGGPHPVQRLLAQNEPNEHIRAAALGPSGPLLATERGLIQGSGSQWSRIKEATGNFQAIAPLGSQLFLGGPDGLYSWSASQLTKLAPQSPRLLAGGAGRLVGVTPGALVESTDGLAWRPVGELPPGTFLSLAVHPTERTQAWLGGHDVIYFSMDGGASWTGSAQVEGDVTAIVPDPTTPDLVWALAGGDLWYSQTGGTNWLRSVQQRPEQIFLSLLLSPDPQLGLVGITADGLVVPRLNAPK